MRPPTDRSPGARQPGRSPAPAIPARVRDGLARPLRDLRISVTDRCNFRCSYCMPRERFGPDFAFLPRTDVLTLEEIARLARVFVAHGVEKLRITGGEPLVRRDLPALVRMLAGIDGVRDLSLTTNGSLLAERAADLRSAGLGRVTVSLDSLDEPTFGLLNGVGFSAARVVEGIERAREVGLTPIKVNMLVRRGVNETSVLPMVRWTRERGYILRLIEFMDVGQSNGWRLDDVVPAAEILATIDGVHPLESLPATYPGEVATRWRYRDGAGEIGVIASVSTPFCGSCTRSRLSAEGKLYTCLFATEGTDLRALLRDGATDDEISVAVGRLWRARDDRYSELRSEHTDGREAGVGRVEMNAMGG